MRLAAFTPNPAAVYGLSPYEVPQIGVPRHSRASRSPGGTLGAEWELHPPRYRPSYRAPPVMNSRVSGASTRAQPPVASRRPQHRPAPHTSQGYRFTPSREGDSHPRSLAQPPGFGPGDPVRVAQRLTPSPLGLRVRSKEGVLQRRVWCRASQDVPPARGSPGRAEGWQPPTPTSGPGVTRAGSPPVYHTAPRRP